jgi:hypothetical protein
MPIKPENRARYPTDWKQIRASILARAGDCCEQCKVPNHARIARGAGDDAGTFMTDDAYVYDAETGEQLGQCRMSDYNVARMTDIVLTVAHLDHVPENCDPANLKALCQRCHLAYDADHHKTTAQATRRARLNTRELFT